MQCDGVSVREKGPREKSVEIWWIRDSVNNFKKTGQIQNEEKDVDTNTALSVVTSDANGQCSRNKRIKLSATKKM